MSSSDLKIIVCTSFKGGVTKSTTAIHLSVFLSDHGKVLLIDGDPNRTAIAWAERGKLPFDVVDERGSFKVIGNYDFAIFDTPARPDSSDMLELAKGCDLLVLPTLPDVVSLDPTLQTANSLSDFKYRVLIAIVPSRPNTDGLKMQAELKAAEVPVFDVLIRKSIGISKAALEGVSARDLKGRDRNVWDDYERLGNEVLELLTDAD